VLLAELAARERIRDCVVRLARGEDRRDAELVRGCFWPDAAVDFGIFAGDFAQYLDWVVPGSPAVPVTQHLLGQTLVVLDAPGTSTARAETLVTAYHRVAAGAEGEEPHRDVLLGGRYLDRLERRTTGSGAPAGSEAPTGEWRIVHRTMLYDWAQELGPSADWAKGVLGAPLSADRFAGRAAGDHSGVFFGPGNPRNGG
jgi:hypothetical protein